MVALYQKLLYLYPRLYRREFAEEMTAVFRDVDADARRGGSMATARFYIREAGGVLHGAVTEHVRRIFGGQIPSPLFPRRFTMRPGFRFPKSTSFLMTVILAGIVLAIDKAEAIRTALPADIAPVGPMWAPHVNILTTIVLTFLLVDFVAAVGWVVLFALHRSGVQRLEETSSAAERS
jgi:hypothetical protein